MRRVGRRGVMLTSRLVRRLDLGARVAAAVVAARHPRPIPGRPEPGIEDMPAPTTEAARLSAEADNDLERLLYDNQGRPVDKWMHYPAVYERYFANRRGTSVRLLEIGVFEGGSLDLWRRYFGPAAVIHGLDIDPACAHRVTPPNAVHIGSQDDPGLLRGIVEVMGGVDIVIDDGSHRGAHQWISFLTLFPLLSDGGLYVIEDLHTAYWANHDGGVGSADSAIGLIEQLIQDQHGWYHHMPRPTPAREWVPAIHVHDSIVVIEKQQVRPPRRVVVPGALRG